MANRKPPRDHADIQVLAARWHAEWTAHDGIDPWLRRHLIELTALVRDERWSWNDLARALNEARILYATGRLWSGRGLCDKVNRLRLRQRRAIIDLTPQDLVATLRQAVGAAAGNFNTININLTGASAASSTPASTPEHRPPTSRAPAPIVAAQASDSPPTPKFRPAKLRNDGRGVSTQVSHRAALLDAPPG